MRGPVLVGLGFSVLLLLHAPLLRLPYYWDEAGYYMPAARDLFLHGSLIPLSTPSNAHPPLVMAYLAIVWKSFGYSILSTRIAMMVLAMFSLVGIFRLARKVSHAHVAWAAAVCTALYPVFFAQSSLAQVDLAAAGLTFWGWCAHFDDRRWSAVAWFALAALAKETAILIPVALLAWTLLGHIRRLRETGLFAPSRRLADSLSLAASAIPLGLWYCFHYSRTGFIFGNPEFFRYNVQSTLQPLRIVLALGLRVWQLVGYLNLILPTALALLLMWQPPVKDPSGERPRIALSIQFEFYAVIATYTLAMAAVGGAVLARYMLPVVPLVIIVSVSTIWRRVRAWGWIIMLVAVGFVAALFINPPYGFSMEDNLAYRDYIVLHDRAEQFLESRYPQDRVLTAWPASDELTRPYLGYVSRPLRVFRVEDFTVEQLMAAAEIRSQFDAAMIFSTKYDPPHSWFKRFKKWQEWKAQFFGYHRDTPPAAAAQILGGKIIYAETLNGQWIAVIEMDQIQEARVTKP